MLSDANDQYSPGFTHEYMYVCLQRDAQWHFTIVIVECQAKQQHPLGLCFLTHETTAYPNANAGRMSAPCCIAIRTKPAVMPICTSATAQTAVIISHPGSKCRADSCAALTGAPPQIHDLLIVFHMQALLQQACPEVSKRYKAAEYDLRCPAHIIICCSGEDNSLSQTCTPPGQSATLPPDDRILFMDFLDTGRSPSQCHACRRPGTKNICRRLHTASDQAHGACQQQVLT